MRLVFAPAAVAPVTPKQAVAQTPPAPLPVPAASHIPATVAEDRAPAVQARHDHLSERHHVTVAHAVPPVAKRSPPPSAQAAQTQPEAGSARAPLVAAAEIAAPAKQEADLTGASLASLESRIDQAVRAAAHMPDAARRQHREGRAQVRFVYQDGAIHDLAVTESSQSRVLDEAALNAVRTAQIPPPPGLLRGRQLALSVWLDFRMAVQG